MMAPSCGRSTRSSSAMLPGETAGLNRRGYLLFMDLRGEALVYFISLPKKTKDWDQTKWWMKERFG